LKQPSRFFALTQLEALGIGSVLMPFAAEWAALGERTRALACHGGAKRRRRRGVQYQAQCLRDNGVGGELAARPPTMTATT